jgi:pyruvate ferredoxin oxidoreductase gamma subunit
VVAFCRIDERAIRLREPVMEPDALIIQDPTLLHQVDLFNGLQAEGYILINSTRSFEELGLGEFAHDFHRFRLCTVPATELALKHLGRPLPNVALLGGFAAISRAIGLDSVLEAVRERFSGALARANVAAAIEAHDIASRARAALDA